MAEVNGHLGQGNHLSNQLRDFLAVFQVHLNVTGVHLNRFLEMVSLCPLCGLAIFIVWLSEVFPVLALLAPITVHHRTVAPTRCWQMVIQRNCTIKELMYILHSAGLRTVANVIF